MLFRALQRGDDALMRAVARQSVRRFAGMEPGRPVGGTYYLYRTLRNLDLDAVLERLMDQAREASPGAAHAARGAARARRADLPRRPAEEGDRGRDPPGAGGRPRRRGDGPHAAQAAARGRRLHARLPRGDGGAAQGDLPAHPQAGRAPGPQAPPRPQGPARLPQHGAPLAVLRRGARRPEVQVPAADQARDLRHRRHLRVGGRLRPLHPPARLRDLEPVLEGPSLRLHRRPRRGHPDVRGRRGHHRRHPPGQHRGRRRVGRRPLRLRPRLRGVPQGVRQGGRPEDHGAHPRRRPEQLPRLPVVGRQGPPDAGPATCTGSTPSPGRTGTPATRSSASTPRTATAPSSAATCASSRSSSTTSPSPRIARWRRRPSRPCARG